MSRLGPVFGALMLTPALLVGCPAQDGPERAEAGRVSRAIDALREADNAGKPELLRALRDQGCDDEQVCAVRSACLAAYELHIRSLESIARALVQSDAGDPLTAATALGAAQSELDRARKLTEDCTRVQGELIRHRRL
jgi:hypothetical protein